MTSNNPEYRIQRALRDHEIQSVLDRIGEAVTPGAVVHAAVWGALEPLLADEGLSISDLSPETKIDPSRYAVPDVQWFAITAAATNRAAQWGAGAQVATELARSMPSNYDDPEAPAPAADGDYRPLAHRLLVTREACDVIAACDDHIRRLADHYGFASHFHRQAESSWYPQLTKLSAWTSVRTPASTATATCLY